MIKLKHWAVAVGFLLTVPIFPQGSITKCNSAPQLLPTMPFSLKDYKPQYAGRSDTVWLPKRQETYLWNGEILEMQPKYLLATYNGPNEISTITTMHSFTNDSLFLVYYQYDDHSRSICETYQFYDTTATRWKIDYRALKSYDQFGNISELMLQGLDTQTGKWYDSIARIDSYVDTNEIMIIVIKRFSDEVWDTIYGHHWQYHYNPDEYIDEQQNFLWNTEINKWVPDVRAFFLLNADGSYYESEWQRWDIPAQEWINVMKFTDIEWESYNNYPNNYKNQIKQRTLNWWTGVEWYAYLKDYMEYPTPGLKDRYVNTYAWDDASSQWFFSRSLTNIHYHDNRKRRYTDSLKNYINEPWLLNYDDSCRWYFYHGALEEMYRVNYDTARKEWLPAARLLYSDFTYFVDNTAIDDIKPQEEKLKIIPNPSKNLVEIINEHRISEISLFDVKGKRVLQLLKQQNNPMIKIDVSQLLRGIYIIRAATEEKRVITDKLIVN